MDIPIKGKTVLVTGATNGIGKVTARELARMGAQVTIVSRNADKCAAVAESIKSETDNPVEFIAADLSTLAGIMQTAAGFKQCHTRLHVLVNNGFFFRVFAKLSAQLFGRKPEEGAQTSIYLAASPEVEGVT
ncbi:MAG: SDR family NAD(P)-dependent oxidoreductase, partial [Candidatus Atribacteria bacterium]|nr:SDR family NAD(P)-dependent oxidoreductase [Candidatus Atribacteria bacterium]